MRRFKKRYECAFAGKVARLHCFEGLPALYGVVDHTIDCPFLGFGPLPRVVRKLCGLSIAQQQMV